MHVYITLSEEQFYLLKGIFEGGTKFTGRFMKDEIDHLKVINDKLNKCEELINTSHKGGVGI